MDKVSPEVRSRIMSLVKSKNTKPEILVFRELKKRGIYFQKHYKVYGKPDVAFPRLKVAVFINGEFWHGKNLERYKNTLSEFWIKKIKANMKRDKKNYQALKRDGWKVIILWDTKIYKDPPKEVDKIIKAVEKVKS
ncbi:MAG: very short patch repair endonuclease [Patescibacteria group bacterium]